MAQSNGHTKQFLPESTGVEKAVPYDVGAEEAVLGSLVLDRDAIVKVAPFLHPSDFYREKNGAFYEAVLNLYNKHEPPDPVTLTNELTRLGHIPRYWQYAEVVSLINATPTSVHIEFYGHIIRRCAVLRDIISVGGEVAAVGYGNYADETEALAEATSLVMKIGQGRTVGRQGYVPLSTALYALMDHMDAMQNGEKAYGVPSGFRDIDDVTGGWQKGDLIILAGRPGHGKSALALDFGRNAATTTNHKGENHNVGWASLEMDMGMLTTRLVSGHAAVPARSIRLGRYMSAEENGKLVDSIGYLAGLPIWIDDRAGQTLSSIVAEANRMKSEHGLDLLIIDYLQLITSTLSGNRARQEEVAQISRGLKICARDLDIPVICLAQLSRAIEERLNHTPQLSDLRESGAIEQDADIVMFINQPSMYPGGEDKKGIAELYIAKHRNGPLDNIPLTYIAQNTTFHDFSPAYQ